MTGLGERIGQAIEIGYGQRSPRQQDNRLSFAPTEIFDLRILQLDYASVDGLGFGNGRETQQACDGEPREQSCACFWSHQVDLFDARR